MPNKILIVDDEIDTCKMLALSLKTQGFQTDYALSGAQALAKIYKDLPDAIVLDLMMPDTDGFEVTRYLRANEPTANLPILILSAIARPDAKDEALRLGATMFLHKPISPRELGAAIRKVLEDKTHD